MSNDAESMVEIVWKITENNRRKWKSEIIGVNKFIL